MKSFKIGILAATLLCSVSSAAIAQSNPEGRYYNADGTRTDNLEAAAASWRLTPEFLIDPSKAQVRAEYAYAYGVSGKGVKIAVLDEGIEASNPALAGKTITFLDIQSLLDPALLTRPGEYQFNGRPNYRLGTTDHGTHVAGIIAGTRDGIGSMGVAYGADLISANFQFGISPMVLERVLKQIPMAEVQGLSFTAAVNNGARIINNSWGAQSKISGDSDKYEAQDMALEQAASVLGMTIKSIEAGAIHVWAAGNEYGNHATPQASLPMVYVDTGEEIADLSIIEPYWVSVVNLKTNSDELSASSSVCGHTARWCIAAPGTDILSGAMLRNLNEEGEALATKAPVIADRDAMRAAVLSIVDRPFDLPGYPRPVTRADLDAMAPTLDPKFLGEELARRLFDVALGYAKSSYVEELRAANPGQIDDMTVFRAVINRYSNIIDDYGLIDFNMYFTWTYLIKLFDANSKLENSPLYYMELEFQRLSEAATGFDNTFGLKTGTSMAAPQVSGGLALVMERFPYMGNVQARDTLLTTARDLGDLGVDPIYGWGAMDLEAAMKGPGAFLRDAAVTLPEGYSDVWSNNISDGKDIMGPGDFVGYDQEFLYDEDGYPLLDENYEPIPNPNRVKIYDNSALEKYKGGLTKDGLGKLTLAGNNAYSGDTIVTEGVLNINGALTQSAAFARTAGIIGGTGTLASLVVEDGGTVNPGDPIGTLTITGNLTFKPGSTYAVDSGVNATPIDKLVVGGVTTIEGGNVKLNANNGQWNIRTRAQILTSAGGVNGKFEGITSNLGFLAPTLTYTANNILLTLQRNDVTFASVGTTPNERSTGAGLDTIPTSGLLYDTLVDGSVDAVQGGLRGLSGEAHASLGSVALNDTRYVRGAVLNRLGYSNMVPSRGNVVWAEAVKGAANFDGNDNVSAVRGDTDGIIVGFDKTWDQGFQLGAVIGQTNTEVRAGRLNSTGKAKTQYLGVYGGFAAGLFRASLGGAWGDTDYTLNRSVRLNALNESLKADYSGETWQAFGEVGLALGNERISYRPYANVTHIEVEGDTFSETGGVSALNGSVTQKLTTGTLGVRAQALLAGGNGRPALSARGNLGWQRELDNDGAFMTARFAGGRDFAIAGVQQPRDLAVVDAGVDIQATDALSFNVTYSGQFGSSYDDHGLRASMRLAF